MRRLPFFALSIVVAAGLSACGGDTDTSTDTTAAFGSPGSTASQSTVTSAPDPATAPKEGDAGVKVSGDLGSKPKVELPGGEPPKELLFKDLTVGTGAEVKAGVSTNFQYVGFSWSTKKEFDTSWGREPFPSDLSSVIPGWTNGIPGMKVGGRRLLVIPPEQGYGEAGSGSNIGPNETLVFVIDAVE